MSLVPSVTETLLAWGVEPVAVTRFCEQPDFPMVGGTKNPDIGAIVALAPDLVVMDEEENRRPDADALSAAGVGLHVLGVRHLTDVAPALAGLAAAVGVELPPSGDGDVDPANVDPANVEPAHAGVVGGPPVRAWVPIWRRPWMTISGDTYASTLLEVAGFANVTADWPDRYPETDLETVAATRPDVVLAPSEPYHFTERHRAELEQVAPVHLLDGRDLFWWGSRTDAARRRLARLAVELG